MRNHRGTCFTRQPIGGSVGLDWAGAARPGAGRSALSLPYDRDIPARFQPGCPRRLLES